MEGGEGEGKGRVCVTGGTGFVASWLIKRLLEHGYFVNTTVRSYTPGGDKDVSYLTNLRGASERLKIFNADLDKPESFVEPINGCIGVFHVAHSVDFEVKEPEVFIQRAINAMLGILQVCINSKKVKKVVYTSSDSTILFNDTDLDVVDEASWSDVDFIREFEKFGSAYNISKTLTEKAGLEFAEKHGLEFVTINPSLIHGPFMSSSCPISVRILLYMVFGDLDPYSLSFEEFQLVHVDDVASAHIFLFENPNAKGRYICSAHRITRNKLAEYLSIRYPEFKIQMIDFGDDTKGRNYPILSSRKLLETRFKYKYSLEDTYAEAIQCCKEKGIL